MRSGGGVRLTGNDVRCGACGADAVWISARTHVVRRGLFAAKLSPHEFKVFVTIAGRLRIDSSSLIEVVWGEEVEGGPDTAGVTLRQFIYRVNHKLSALGVTLRHLDGFGWEVADLRAQEKAA